MAEHQLTQSEIDELISGIDDIPKGLESLPDITVNPPPQKNIKLKK